MKRIASALTPFFIVFAASACGLIIEIVAARILAPTIGVSLFTWTSVIGIVLAGISLGNYLGGLVADRFPHTTTLGLILLSAGSTSLAILPLVGIVSDVFAPLPILLRIILITSSLFLIPSIILGMVTPVIIKLNLQSLDQTGNVVGRIYAVSTAGSIFGVFITGFVLIQWIGTRPILLGVAIFLVLMAFIFGNLWRIRVPGAAILAIFAGIASLSFLSGSFDSGCQEESNYFCIKVRERTIEDRTVRTLTLDQLVHSYVELDDPTFLVYSYEKVFADLATMIGERNPDFQALFIGGGGYTMPRFLEFKYPESQLEVIEIDPKVTEVAHDYLGFSRKTEIVTYNSDARTTIPTLSGSRYDLIVGDAFNDVSVPYHLTTLEFNNQIRGILKDNGIYMVNVVDRQYSGKFLKAYTNTLGKSFPYVYVLRDDELWDDDNRYTFVVAASLQPIEYPQVVLGNLRAKRGNPVTKFMPPEEFNNWIHSKKPVLLTDDYVPVDNMLAPLYLESR